MSMWRRVTAVVALAVLVLSSCTAGDAAPDELRIVVPTPPGGGFDLTARVVASALEESGSGGRVTVVNLAGEQGMAALSRLSFAAGDSGLLLQMGLGLVANAHTRGFGETLAGLTPLVRVIEEAEAVLVARESAYQSLDDVITDLRERTGEIRVGGGSYPGGPDHLGTMYLAEGIGVEPASVNYQPHDGGGEMLAALVSGAIDVAVAGTAQHLHAIRAGEVRVLAVTGPRRAPGIDAPTLTEAGIDVEFMNWRGLLAPPGLTDEQRDTLIAMLDRVRGTRSWQNAMARHGWSDAWLTGPEFAAFLRAEQAKVGDLLDTLGVP